MKRLKIPLLLATLLLFGSCDHHSLCFDEHLLGSNNINVSVSYNQIWHESYALYDTIVDISLDWLYQWSDIYEVDRVALHPDVPTGVRAVAYRDGKRLSAVNLGTYGGSFSLDDGDYSLIFYNNDTEYIIFNDRSSMNTVTAGTRTRTRSTYGGNSLLETRTENTVSAPDVLYCYYIESYTAAGGHDTELDIEMRPIVYTYVVHCEFAHGFEYVALARGALAGMAGSAFLKDGTTTDDVVTILFDCDLTENGASASVNSFGIPNYTPEATVIDEAGQLIADEAHRYGLTIEVMLRNGKMKTFDFDVTDQVAIQPNGGVITVEGLEISDEEAAQGGSGFGVNINGWGEYEDVVIPLGK
jgi:hypothetical protein